MKQIKIIKTIYSLIRPLLILLFAELNKVLSLYFISFLVLCWACHFTCYSWTTYNGLNHSCEKDRRLPQVLRHPRKIYWNVVTFLNKKLHKNVKVLFLILIIFYSSIKTVSLVSEKVLKYFLLKILHENSETLRSFEYSSFETDLIVHLESSLSSDSFEIIEVMVFFVERVAFFNELTKQKMKNRKHSWWLHVFRFGYYISFYYNEFAWMRKYILMNDRNKLNWRND